MEPRYHINLFRSDEDGAWVADVPDLEYCSAHGDTPERALAEVRLAAAAWVASAREQGRRRADAALPTGDLRRGVHRRRVTPGRGPARRGLLRAAPALALAGCGEAEYPLPLRGLLDTADARTFAAQRLLLPKDALAREFPRMR